MSQKNLRKMYKRRTSPIKEGEIQQSEAVDYRLSPDIIDQAIEINPIKPTDLKSIGNFMCSKSTKTTNQIELNTDSKDVIKQIKETE